MISLAPIKMFCQLSNTTKINHFRFAGALATGKLTMKNVMDSYMLSTCAMDGRLADDVTYSVESQQMSKIFVSPHEKARMAYPKVVKAPAFTYSYSCRGILKLKLRTLLHSGDIFP